MKQSYTDEAYKTFSEEVAGALDGKEGFILEMGATGGVQLYTATGKFAIGVMHGKLQGGNDITVRLLNKGGTVKVTQGGAIAPGARLKAAAGGKVVVSAGGGERTLGVKLQPQANGADGESCEIHDVIEYVP